MSISLIHPSRSRPDQALSACINWMSKAQNIAQVEYILSVDTDDPQLLAYQKMEIPGTLIVNDNRSVTDAVNIGAEHSTGDVLIVMSDDFDCTQNWDELIKQTTKDKTDWILKTYDGIQEWIITLPIMDRVYYNRFGYIYNPMYMHMFCDTEMTVVGDLLERTITANDIIFKHKHYSTGQTPKDSLNTRNDTTWKQGQQVYVSRVKTNFGLSDATGRIKNQEHINWLYENHRIRV